MKYSKLLLSTILVASIVTSNASAKNYTNYSHRKMVVAQSETGYSVAASYINHVNNARFALTASDEDTALSEIDSAYAALKDLETSEEYYKITHIKAGRTLYKYTSSDNYYYFPLESTSAIDTEDYLYAFKAKDYGNDLETVYLEIDPNNTDSKALLSDAYQLTNNGNYEQADEALAELIHRNVLTEKVVAMPQEKARLALTAAKYYVQANNINAAVGRLNAANVALRNMISSKGYYQRNATLETIRDNALALKKQLLNGTISNDAAVASLDSWIEQLRKLYRA